MTIASLSFCTYRPRTQESRIMGECPHILSLTHMHACTLAPTHTHTPHTPTLTDSSIINSLTAKHNLKGSQLAVFWAFPSAKCMPVMQAVWRMIPLWPHQITRQECGLQDMGRTPVDISIQTSHGEEATEITPPKDGRTDSQRDRKREREREGGSEGRRKGG